MFDPIVVSVRRSARLVMLALDLTKRATRVAPDLRQCSLERAWLKLAEIENRLRPHLEGLRSLWNKSWAERWHALGRRLDIMVRRSAGFRLWNKSWAERWHALGRRLDIMVRRSAGFRLWNKSWAERRDVIGRRLGLVRSAGFKKAVETSVDSERWDKTWNRVQQLRPSYLRQHEELRQPYIRAMSVYYPSPLAVPILYIALEHSGGGWRRMSPEIEFIDAPGHHWKPGRGCCGGHHGPRTGPS